MTPRERVMEVLKMPWRPDPDPYAPGRREFLTHEELEGRLEQAITAAVEAERERWKTAVRKYVRPKYLADNVIRDMENCNSIATETKNT